MKIALCLSGQLRSIDLIKDKLLENIIIPNNCDVFCHTWHKYDNSKYYNFYNPSDNEFAKYGQYCFKNIEKIINHLNPLSFEFECPFILENTKSMFYSIMKSNKIMSNYEKYTNKKYDIIIRSRWDLLFESKLIIDNIDNIEKNTIYLSFRPGGCGGVNTCFSYGRSDVMKTYCNLYTEYEHTERIRELCPEGVLLEYLNNKKIMLKKVDNEYSVIREDGGTIKVN